MDKQFCIPFAIFSDKQLMAFFQLILSCSVQIKDKKAKDEENGALTKYNVTGSNEEEDSDDDEGVDLSKYDLIVSDEEESQVR